MTMGMDLWNGLDTATTFEHGTYLMYGAPVGSSASYTLAVQKCIVKATQRSGICLIVETEVLVSTCPMDPPGSKRTWLVKLDNPNVGWPNIKGFIYAVLGLSAGKAEDAANCAAVDQVIKGIMNLAVGERNMLSGAIANVDLTTILTEKKKEPFNRHQWRPAVYPDGVPRPDWSALMSAAPAAGQMMMAPPQRAPAQTQQWGAPPAQTQQWGQAPPQGAPAQFGPPQGSPPQWGAAQQAPAWGVAPPQGPPPMPPPQGPPPGPQLPPGAIVRDGMYWAPNMPSWLPLPK